MFWEYAGKVELTLPWGGAMLKQQPSDACELGERARPPERAAFFTRNHDSYLE